MTGPMDILYENHLKNAYRVKGEDRNLVITDSSCYQLSEATSWLIAGLPEAGEENVFLDAMAALGLTEPKKIFEKLVSIGVLREKSGRTWKSVAGMFLMPKIKLISAQLQERFFSFFSVDGAGGAKGMKLLSIAAVLGLLYGMVLLVAGPERTLPFPLAGVSSGVAVFLLVIIGSLLHELGHSFAAMSAGIGFRPIGFSVYLIYPVFYTNVSGIEKVSLGKKALIDCGGFIFQGLFLLLLILVSAVTGNASCVEAARWIVIIVFFNLNPLFRTDGYWLYNDVYSEFTGNRWARAVHYLYLAAFVGFSIYFMWMVGGRLGYIWNGLLTLVRSPETFFSGGYRIVMGAYFILVGLSGGVRRFQEGHQEWKKLRGIVAENKEPAQA